MVVVPHMSVSTFVISYFNLGFLREENIELQHFQNVLISF